MRQRTALTILVVLLLSACSTTIFGGVRGSGDLTTETRDVADFDEVVLQGSGRVDISVTGTESLTIEAEDNLMGSLTSEVRDGSLILGVTGSVLTTREIVYTVTAATLNGVTIEGSGTVATGDISADTFEATISGSGYIDLTGVDLGDFAATISGSGNIDAEGTVTDLAVEIPGSGRFSGEELVAATGDVIISGSGNAIVNVTDTLEATVTGSGSIEYLGGATVNSDISGSGSIRAR